MRPQTIRLVAGNAANHPERADPETHGNGYGAWSRAQLAEDLVEQVVDRDDAGGSAELNPEPPLLTPEWVWLRASVGITSSGDAPILLTRHRAEKRFTAFRELADPSIR